MASQNSMDEDAGYEEDEFAFVDGSDAVSEGDIDMEAADGAASPPADAITAAPSPPASTQPKKLSFSTAAQPSPGSIASAAAMLAALTGPAAKASAASAPTGASLLAPSRSSSVAAGSEGMKDTSRDGENMHVVLRVRPLHEHERAAAAAVEPVLSIESAHSIRFTAPEASQSYKNGERTGTFSFSHVFPDTVSQADMYESVMAAPTVAAVHEGKSAHIFAYGMTNAGKTFTITGSDDQPGILPRTLASVFRQVQALGEAGVHPAASRLPPNITPNDVCVLVSYLEVYNEQCYDLLASGNVSAVPTGTAATGASSGFAGTLRGGAHTNVTMGEYVRPALQIKDGRDGRAYVRNLRHVTVKSTQAALELMKEGAANKRMAETHMNADSSRSHTVFTINIIIRAPTVGSDGDAAGMGDALLQEIVHTGTGAVAAGYRLWSRISVVDLAGSERQARTQSSGVRLKEAARINNSLMVLMQCFEAMRWNSSHPEAKRLVPFRETKLTRLFADSLGGASTGSTVMIVNAGPGPADFDETLHALKYGALARDVKVQKDRVLTRARPDAYTADGRRVGAAAATAAAAHPTARNKRRGAVDADEEEIVIVEEHVKPKTGPTRTKRPIAPPPVNAHAVAQLAAAGTHAASADVGRVSKVSISSSMSGSSAISSSLIAAALTGHAQPLTHMRSQTSLSLTADTVDHESDIEEDEPAAPPADAEAWAAEREQLLAHVSSLQGEVAVLSEALEDAQDSAAGVEAQIREDVAAEMTARITSVEEEYAKRLKSETARLEERISKMMKLHELRNNGAPRPHVAPVVESDEDESMHHDRMRPGRGGAAATRGRGAQRTSSTIRPLSRARGSGPSAARVSALSTSSAATFGEEEEDVRLEEALAQVGECEAELARVMKRAEEEASNLRAEIKRLREAFAEAEDTIAEQAEEIEHMASSLNKLQQHTEPLTSPSGVPAPDAQHDTLKARVHELEAQCTWLTRELEAAHASETVAKTASTSAQATIADLQKRVAELQQRLQAPAPALAPAVKAPALAPFEPETSTAAMTTYGRRAKRSADAMTATVTASTEEEVEVRVHENAGAAVKRAREEEAVRMPLAVSNASAAPMDAPAAASKTRKRPAGIAAAPRPVERENADAPAPRARGAAAPTASTAARALPTRTPIAQRLRSRAPAAK